MDREELERRYREAQFHAMAIAAERQPAEDHQQDSNDPAEPTLAQIIGVMPGKDRYLSENDRLRRWAGLN